jgi:hypothetical protein
MEHAILVYLAAGVTGIYNRAAYAKEMREALERWAEHVETLTRYEKAAHSTPRPGCRADFVSYVIAVT